MINSTTKERVIFTLVRNNGQLYKELIKSAKTNQNSLTITLRQLEADKIIKKNDKDNKYYFSVQLRNKVLKALPRAYDLAVLFTIFSETLEKEENKIHVFTIGGSKLYELIRLQIMIKIERYAAVKLTKRDKLEFDLYADLIDGCIEWIFRVMKKMDAKKTQKLKRVLFQRLK